MEPNNLALRLAALGAILLTAAAEARVPAPYDWSHKHVIFASPDTREEALAKGAYAAWERNRGDPRFVLALLRKAEREQARAGGAKAVAARASEKAAASVGDIVEHYYLTILGRAPDAAGKAFFQGEVERLAAVSVDRREALRVISKSFFFSPEYVAANRSDGDFVEDLYRAYLQRASDPTGKAHWVAQLSSGIGREALMVGFMFSEEFQAFMDAALGESSQRPETALVMDVYRAAFTRLPDQDGFTSWRDSLRAAQCGGTVGARARELASAFFSSPEYVNRNTTSRQHVADLYDAVLRRSPDVDGLAHWAGSLDSGAMTRAQLLESFFASPEWEARLAGLDEAGCYAVQRDWSNVMGGAGGTGSPGIFPAKYNFDISSTPSCTDDFVVYPTSAAGAIGSGTFAAKSGTFTGNPSNGQTVTITNGTRVLVLTASTGSNTNLSFQRSATTSVVATNLANAINRNGGVVGVRASVAGSTVTVTSLTQGASAITVTEGLGSFTWAGGNGALAGGSGTAGQPTIVAFNNIYKTTCGGVSGSAPVPTVMWSYDTSFGTGGVVDSSPVISLDGTQVAFIQRIAGVAYLGLLKWSASAPGGIGTPTQPALVTPANYRACTAPCVTGFALAGNPDVTNSALYYHYQADEMWVGDDSGVLHKITGAFNGTPAEAGSPWPVTVSAGRILSPPVYDSTQGKIYVGTDREANTTVGGRLHSVDNTTGAVDTSILLAGDVAATHTGSTGVAEAVIVDQLAQRLYAFVGTDTSTSCGGVECHAVYQFNTTQSLASQAAPPKQVVGRGQIFTRVMYAGVFDDAYYASTPTSPTGFLYVCGSNGGAFATSRNPNLWRIPITNNVMGAAQIGPSLVSGDTSDASGGGGTCSPMTDVVNNGDNYIFVGVPGAGNKTGCTGACIYMFDITSVTAASWPTTNATAGLQVVNGTSGIIVDNTSSAAGASQVYFMWLGNPGNAIQASQGALN